jgi:hypothetical protein
LRIATETHVHLHARIIVRIVEGLQHQQERDEVLAGVIHAVERRHNTATVTLVVGPAPELPVVRGRQGTTELDQLVIGCYHSPKHRQEH